MLMECSPARPDWLLSPRVDPILGSNWGLRANKWVKSARFNLKRIQIRVQFKPKNVLDKPGWIRFEPDFYLHTYIRYVNPSIFWTTPIFENNKVTLKLMIQDSFEIIYGKTYSSLFGMYLASIWLKLVNDKIINAMKVENDIISKKIRQSQVQSQTACLLTRLQNNDKSLW